MKKNDELTLKYYDLWGATLMNILTQTGIPIEILEKTDSIVKNAIKKPQDIMYHHRKLMQMREVA